MMYFIFQMLKHHRNLDQHSIKPPNSVVTKSPPPKRKHNIVILNNEIYHFETNNNDVSLIVQQVNSFQQKLNAKLNMNKKVEPEVVQLDDVDDDMTGLNKDQHSTMIDKISQHNNAQQQNPLLNFQNLPYEPFVIEETEITNQKHEEIAQKISEHYAQLHRNVSSNITKDNF